jgi:hypothetical protein
MGKLQKNIKVMQQLSRGCFKFEKELLAAKNRNQLPEGLVIAVLFG